MIEIDDSQANICVDIGVCSQIAVGVEPKRKIDVVIGDAAKMDCEQAINYIKSGETELQPLVITAQNAAANAISNAVLAKQWAIGDPSEPVGNSAKYWADQAASISLDLANKDLSNLSAAGEAKFDAKQDVISDLTTIRSGAEKGATAVQPADLATVATSGLYSDLSGTPIIPAAQVNSDWNANSGVAQILNKPTIPTVNNATISFTQGGVSKGSITLNQATDQTIALDAGGGGGGSYTAGTGIDITNDVISVTAPTLTNTATGTNSLTILGDSGIGVQSVNIGSGSSSLRNGVAIGYLAKNTGSFNVCVGYNSSNSVNIGYSIALGGYARTTAAYAIQLGYGTNSEANSFYVSTSSSNNWKMLGSDGKIPVARLPIAAHVVETYSNGADWYRLWSDGWCEQGGSATGNGNSGRTVSLLKTYSDTNYNIQAEITDYTSSSQKIVSIGSKTASDFKAYTSTTGGWGSYAFDWCAGGYIS